MTDMTSLPNLPSTSVNKYQETFLYITEFDPIGFYEPTYFLFAHQRLDGIPIHLFPEYMNLKTARLWKRPLNPVERLTGPLKDILETIKEVYKLSDKADQIPGHTTEKRYLKHTLWFNQLLWFDLDLRLSTYVRKKMGPEATVKDMIDQWDDPSTAWSEHFIAFFEDALGYETDNGMEVWDFGDNMLDLIDTSKMLLADAKEWVDVDQTAKIGASSTEGPAK